MQAGPLHNGLQEARAERPMNGAEVQSESESSAWITNPGNPSYHPWMQQQKLLQHQLCSQTMHNGPMQSGPTYKET